MNLATKHNDPMAPLSWTERIGFGIGGFSARMVFIIIGSFFTVYMTNVAFLDIAVISTIIAASKVFDGISDLIVGHIVDHTSSPYGKARIWLVRICIPFAVSAFLLFHVPQGWAPYAKYIYVFLLYNLTTTVFMTFMQISQYSLLTLITGSSREHGLLGSIMNFFVFGAQIVVNFTFVKFLMLFSDTPGEQNTQRGYTYTLLIFLSIMILTALVAFFSTKERVVSDPGQGEKKSSAKFNVDALKALLTERNWIILIICSCIVNIITQFNIVGGTYYALYILKDMDAISWLVGMMMVPVLIMQFVNPILMRRFHKKWIYAMGCLILILANLGLGLVSPYKPGMMLFIVLKGCGLGMNTGTFFGLMGDLITKVRDKTGIQVSGLGNAGSTAAEKLGQGLGIAIFGFVMAAAGFNGALQQQPASVSTAVSNLFIWFPMCLCAIMLLIFLPLYKKE